MSKESNLEEEIFSFGASLLDEMRENQKSSYSLRGAEDRILNWAMRHEKLKVNLFRFVDVLPALRSASDVVRHVHEYFQGVKDMIPLFKYALKVSPDSILSQGAAFATRQQVRKMSRRFIVGENPKDALPYLKNLRKRGLSFTVDLLGEAALSEVESEVYIERYIALIHSLKEKDTVWRQRFPLKNLHPKDTTLVNVSIKLSALYSQGKAVDFEHSVEILSERLVRILNEVKKADGIAYVDMEDCAYTDITLEVVKRVYLSDEFKDYSGLGMVLQAYLRRTDEDLSTILEWAKKRSSQLQIRLVKGAYWDTEILIARQNNWPIPVFLEKKESDQAYENLSKRLLDNSKYFYPAFASHNIRSISHAVSYARHLGISPTEFEIQTLYGMGDEFKSGLIQAGLLVRDYAPVGELIPGMGYLVRRLLENTANEGFLRKTNFEKINIHELLKAPESTGSELSDKPFLPLEEILPDEFVNTSFIDFTLSEERDKMQKAVNSIHEKLINGPFIVTPKFKKGNLLNEDQKKKPSRVSLPENISVTYSETTEADTKAADYVLNELKTSFVTWSKTLVSDRAQILRKAGNIMLNRRYELASMVSFEAGKSWIEADADVAEAIDFCFYYAQEAERIFAKRRMGTLQGEYNSYFYEPRGISAVITPWNFALAIPTGMFASSLVCGNCVVLKPAEQTPVIAQAMFDIFIESGMPADVAAFLPGKGEEIGAYISKDPRVSTVVFTGSREVGFELIRSGGETSPDAVHIKRVIAEMGGKNAIIVDSDADLDEAVKGIIHSAFSFQGQKCSACSRVYVVSEEAYERCKERLSHAIESVKIGAASDPGSFMGPVISYESKEKLLEAIRQGSKEGSLVAKGKIPDGMIEKGYYVLPHIFEGLPEDSDIVKNELFGPLLVISKVDTFEEGIEKALKSKYRLTGGVYSRSPRNIEYAVNEFKVGNLYINRNCTGALVFRQPFGGAHFSGVGAKAGGPDYLLQFVVPRTVTENTMRRGFAPEVR
jgi:RHH-type transcriptional regulator, proline utilization regulon repressor / proline dehydrogenase / delta 1-pyrroline-5-carboxylate dehydrogenase